MPVSNSSRLDESVAEEVVDEESEDEEGDGYEEEFEAADGVDEVRGLTMPIICPPVLSMTLLRRLARRKICQHEYGQGAQQSCNATAANLPACHIVIPIVFVHIAADDVSITEESRREKAERELVHVVSRRIDPKAARG